MKTSTAFLLLSALFFSNMLIDGAILTTLRKIDSALIAFKADVAAEADHDPHVVPYPYPDAGDPQGDPFQKAEPPRAIPVPIPPAPKEQSGSEAMIQMIKSFESFRPSPYRCPAGKLTIGYGFTDRKYVRRSSLSEEEASRILINEVIPKVRLLVRDIVTVKLAKHEEDALVSFTFNCGEGNLRRLVADRLNKGKRLETAEAMKKYVKAKVDGAYITLSGLVKRRNAEAAMFLGSTSYAAL